VPPIGSAIRNVAPGLDAVNLDPSVALEEYGLMILKIRALHEAVFGSKLVRAFLRGTPGLEAWAMLGKAFFHASPPSGRADYDLVILDGPATGHGLDMLRVPQVIVDVAPPGLLRREAERALSLLRDPARGGVALVTLPEDMPVNEACELHEALRNELRIPVAKLIVNGTLPYLFDPSEEHVLTDLPSRVDPASPLASLVRAGRARILREQVQRHSIDLLDQRIPAPRIELPLLFTADFGPDDLRKLASKLAASP
jgi:anion-transporting  ArsA/GET3 family ATPase